MTEEVTKTEARQGDRRHMNLRVLMWGIPAIVILFGIIYALWA
jgi:hypothetical protein